MATAKTPARRTPAPKPATAPTPQDHKPQADDAEATTQVVVELDGVAVTLDLAVYRNTRLMRRMTKEDPVAFAQFLSALFPDLDELEEKFNLNLDEDYAAFIQRAMDAVPNSAS